MKGKQQKFLDLYQPIHERFERFCRARAYADMPYEDLMNESLLIAYQKIGGLKKKDSFLSFLIGISLRILANHRRKKKAQAASDELVFENYAQPDNAMEQQFELELLYQGLSQLPDVQREALILFEITGFSIKEIAEMQESSPDAVKQRLVRGRKALAKIIKSEMKLKKEGPYEG